MSFPKKFLWGASTSAFQVEGAKGMDGAGLTVADLRTEAFGKIKGLADTTVAVDFYHHYKEDIKLMKEAGFTSFRMSISWARLIPDGNGEVNCKAVDFYNDVFNELKANGIEPIVTLYHFDLPIALINQYKGFYSRSCIDDFVRYAKICFDLFGDRVKYWLTINEQQVICQLPFFQGLETKKEAYQAYHHMNIANALVIKLYHSLNLGGMIGPAISYTTVYPASPHPKDVWLAYEQDDIWVFGLCDVEVYGTYPKYFLNALKKEDILFETQEGDDKLLKDAKPDFFGINWYCTSVIGRYIGTNMAGEYEGVALPRQDRAVEGQYQYYTNPFTPYSEYNWNCDGTGLRYALRKMYSRYHLPLLITENGWSANECIGEDGKIHDDYRIAYFKEMVENMSLAIEDGVELIGFNPWSFVDVLSASQGMDKRYGLVFVDRTNDNEKSCQRICKDSYYWYKEVIRSNGENY